MPKPLIGVTVLHRDYKDEPRAYLAVRHTYTRAVSAAGGLPVLIPLHLSEDDLRALFDRLDGLLLTGGGDVDPASFGKTATDKVAGVDPERDRVELLLSRWAVAERKPFLAVCRGIQVLNVAHGGSLELDILSDRPDALQHTFYPDHPRDTLAHAVSLAAGSRLAAILGSQRIEVNSLHHQACETVARTLTVTGHATDGTVEAVEVNDPAHPFGIGVQWHPEWLPDRPESRALFAAFVTAAGEA